MDDRRDLEFDRIEEVMPEVQRLLAGPQTRGHWTFGQILHHLATAVRLSLVPESSDRESTTNPALERTFEVRRRRFFRSGRFPDGLEVPHPALQPPLDPEASGEADSLRQGIERLASAQGPFRSHPLLGPLSKQEWIDFHRIHCAHHLSFVDVAPFEDRTTPRS